MTQQGTNEAFKVVHQSFDTREAIDEAKRCQIGRAHV